MTNHSKVNINLSIPVTFLREGKYFIAYTPVLDLSTSGKSFAEVRRRFEEVVQIFFEELIEKRTLEKVLTELGWQKVQKQWSPPVLISQEFTRFSIPAYN